MSKRVLVTGIGCICPLGNSTKQVWERLVAGESGLSLISHLKDDDDYRHLANQTLPIHVVGAVKGLSKLEPAQKFSKTSRFIQLAAVATAEALSDAHWEPVKNAPSAHRTGISFGSGVGSLQDITDTYENFKEKGWRTISPYFISNILINLAAGRLSIQHNLQGPNHSVVTACATGAHSIIDGYKSIVLGDADVMVVGSSESSLNPLAIYGFNRMKSLTRSLEITGSCPFDARRDGFVMSEGAACLVLESEEHALSRGAKIYAEIKGYGESADAHHISSPPENGDGSLRSMQSALRSSGLGIEQIDYINAHATSTPLGDAAENSAIKELFKERAKRVSVSSIKGSLGHMLGAAGSVEGVVSALAIYHQTAPPTINFRTASSEFDLDYVANTKKLIPIRHCMSNSFGFGGTNSSIIFSKYQL